MNIAIVDDEKAARLEVKYLVNEYFPNDSVIEYNSGKEIIKNFNKYTIDIAFIDIHLGDIDGLMVAQILKEVNPKCKIIFVTAYDEYVTNSYEIGVFDYLTKPLVKDRFELMVKRLKESLNSTNLLVTTYMSKTYFIDINSIVYIESLERKVWIYTTDDSFKTIETLSELEEKLPDNFYKCHKSYIVNLNYITRIEHYGNSQYDIVLKYYDNSLIPLSRLKIKEIKDLIETLK